MKSTEYNEKVLDHFRNPRNVGVLEGDDVITGTVGNPTCGDIMEVYVKIDKDVIKDIKFRTFGCGSAIATTSMMTEMVKGKDLNFAKKLTRKDVADALGGLPPIKMHCSNLAADALHAAIKNYEKGKFSFKEIKEEKVTIQTTKIINELEYLGKGVAYVVSDYENYRDQRVLLLFKGEESIEIALGLTKVTNRVVLTTPAKELETSQENLKRIKDARVKILTESLVLAIDGEEEVERVQIRNLDENEDYWLFTDAVIILQSFHVNSACSTE